MKGLNDMNMFIRSQDGKKIFPSNKAISIDYRSPTEILYWFDIETYLRLGSYATEARAKEVMDAICSWLEDGMVEIEPNYRCQRNVFQMPKE